MKQTFLRWRTQSALRKNKSLRTSTAFKRSNSFGIIFTVEDRQKHDEIKDLVRKLEQDGKQVKVLEYLPKLKENYEFLFDFFTIKDLSFWGSIRNAAATQFMQTQFDYLFYVDSVHNPLVLNLLANSKAHCRVGQYQEENASYFEFMIDNKGTLHGLVENMYNYTKQLH